MNFAQENIWFGRATNATWNRRKTDCKMGATSECTAASGPCKSSLISDTHIGSFRILVQPRRTMYAGGAFVYKVCVCSPCGFARSPVPSWTSSWCCWSSEVPIEITREARAAGGWGRSSKVFCTLRRRTSPARTHCTPHTWDRESLGVPRKPGSGRHVGRRRTDTDVRERKMLASLLLPGN